METLWQYLNKHHTKKSAESYHRAIELYLHHTGKAKAKHANYQDILLYIGKQRQQYSNGNTVKAILGAIKKYYHWLCETAQRQDHPCRYMQLKGLPSRDIQLQDIFTKQELELLLSYEPIRHKHKAPRDKTVISLLIYQGLTVEEMENLRVSDINLQAATIHVKPTKQNNGRILPIESKQIMLLHNYIEHIRPGLLKNPAKESGNNSDKLFITYRRSDHIHNSIRFMLRQLGKHFPGRPLHTKTIRMSVIANLLKTGEDIRTVQIFAGHKRATTTERYKPNKTEELKAQVQKYHPLQ